VATEAPAGRAASSRLTIGTVAGLRPEKNLARLIRAFAALRARQDARLVIVGDGPERSVLADLARALEVAADVEFTGYLAEPGRRLREFDLFALSSDTEQLPMSMLEAMACGVPVVATRVGDVADVLPEVAHAGLCAANDEAFRECLLAAVDQRANWPVWVAAGRARVEAEYSEGRMVAEWDSVFAGTHPLLRQAVRARAG